MTNAGLSANGLGARAGISGASVRSALAGYRVSPFIKAAIARVLTTDARPVRATDLWPLEVQS